VDFRESGSKVVLCVAAGESALLHGTTRNWAIAGLQRVIDLAGIKDNGCSLFAISGVTN